MSAKPGFRLGKLLCLEERGGFLPVCRISISALPSAISSPFCLGNGDERSFGPVQKMDVLVRAVRQFCDSSTEMSFHSSVPPSSALGTCAEQTGPAWYRKNHHKTPIDFSRVMVSLPVSASLQGQVSEVVYVHLLKAVLLSSCANLVAGVCFQLQKRQITVRILSIL